MKAFVITLLENQISLTLANSAVDSAKKFDIELIIWPAVNGLLYGKEKLKNLNLNKILKKVMIQRTGVLGCFLSHYELWMHCVNIDTPILILEHDAMFIRSIPKDIETQFTDILKLDPFYITDPEYHKNVKDSATEDIQYFYQPTAGSSKAGEYTLGAHGYCITPSGATKLIDFANNVGILPTDLHIGNRVVDIKCTTVSVISLQETHSYLNTKQLSSTTDLEKFGEN